MEAKRNRALTPRILHMMICGRRRVQTLARLAASKTVALGRGWCADRAVIRLIGIAVLALALHCAAAAQTYQLIEVPNEMRFVGGMIAIGQGRTQEQRGIVWLDNHRVMFRGYRPGPSRQVFDRGIYIWNVESGEVTLYGDEQNFCYAEGWIYLWTTSELRANRHVVRVDYRHGPIGKEVPGICEMKVGESKRCLDELTMSCKLGLSRWATPLGPESRIEAQLRDVDGIIVARSANARIVNRDKYTTEDIVLRSREPVLLLNAAFPRGKPLPIQEAEEIGMKVSAYSEFAGKYVLVPGNPKDNRPGSYTNWPDNLPHPIYLMQPGGEVETVMLQKLKDWTGVRVALPVKSGLAYLGDHGRTGGGVFLYDGKATTVIARGSIGSLAVSANGCRMAMGLIEDYGKSRRAEYRLKYLNFCGDRG